VQSNPTDVRARAACCLTFFFLVMVGYYLMRPVRESLFLTSEGLGNFPKVHIVLVFVTWAAAYLYDRLARTFGAGWLAVRCMPLFSMLIAIFWACLKGAQPATMAFRALVWTYYLGVSLYVVFSVAIVWSLTHGVFTPDEGKRYYGVIGTGGILGGYVGGKLTGLLVGPLGSIHLPLVSAAVLVPCYFLARWLDRQRLPEELRGAGIPSQPASHPVSAWSLLVHNRYVAGIALLVALVMAFQEFGDHQTQRLLTQFGLRDDELTRFWGLLYERMNLLAGFISLFLTRWVLTRFGPGPGLILLPLVGAAKTLAVYFWPTQFTLTLMLSLNLASQYSLFQASKELLYSPTPEEIRMRAKTVIDTFIFRLGPAFSALFVLTVLLPMGQAPLSASILVCTSLAGVVGFWLQARFRQLSQSPGES